MSDCGNPTSHPPSDCATNIFSLQTFSTLAIRVVRNYDYLDLKRNDVYKPYQQYSSTSKRINLRLAEEFVICFPICVAFFSVVRLSLVSTNCGHNEDGLYHSESHAIMNSD